MPCKTIALVLREIGGSFRAETVQLDDIRPDEALVEVSAVGICHTDLSCASGVLPATAPAVFGHEGAGQVVKVGSDITAVKPGDKVILSYAHCTKCDQCSSHHPAYCYFGVRANLGGGRFSDDSKSIKVMDNGEVLGNVPVFSNFFGQSSFARHAVVHMSCLVKVPDETDLALFAPLGCGLSTGVGTVFNTLNVLEGCTFAVFGVGSVGLASVMAAKIRKAKTIIAIDVREDRLHLAQELGATHTILASEGDIVRRIRNICPPNGVNYAADCSGVPSVVATMVECLGTRGRGATVGAPSPGKKVEIDILDHLFYGKEYVGCGEGDAIATEVSLLKGDISECSPDIALSSRRS